MVDGVSYESIFAEDFSDMESQQNVMNWTEPKLKEYIYHVY